MLNHKEENHEKSSLTLSLSLSFWLHVERNGFYLGSDILGGSYVQVTTANINNIINNIINESFPSNNLYPQSYSNNPYAQYYPPTSSFPNNSNTVSLPNSGGTGGLFSEISFGYKYFLGKKRIIGFRHSLFFGYQVGYLGGYLGGLIAFLPYGFDTDLLINLWKNDDLDKRHSSTDYIVKRSSGFVIGVNIGASTWLSPAATTIDTTTIFQFQGKFGVRWNRDKYNAGRYLGGSSIEVGVKVPAFGVYDNTIRRVVSVYLNYTYNFKSKN
ncbi:outer membrane beta-barrel protein [Helicobacter pylori]|uniref:outer membrane beta-barrel protein n=1 Tax=Helicobacter pylori TaxID=210 RepID=UPI00059CA585|nr:outer membrane beta-barrel protein [Helicobacter pylori]